MVPRRAVEVGAMIESLVVILSLIGGFAFYGAIFYITYLFYKQIRGIRQALDRIADKDTL